MPLAMMPKFQCSSCGLCCKGDRIKGIMPQKEDGSCIYLSDNNRCKIYKKRPDLCNVRKTYEKNVKQYGITEVEYYKFNSAICNRMITEEGLDPKFLIDIGKYDSNIT